MRRERQRKRRARFRRIVTGLICLILIIQTGKAGALEPTDRFLHDDLDLLINPFFSEEILSSKNALLIRLENHKVLFEKASEEIIYPASMTKMMTAILAIEQIEDLNQSVRLDESLFPPLIAEGASMAGFSPGETLRVIDLLYGCLLPSGGEASCGLAVAVSGSEAEFAVLMNQKAELLGMQNTHFVTATGLHDDDHYTTMRDMAILLEYCLQNEQFREIFTAREYTTAPTNYHPEGHTMRSVVFALISSPEYEGGKVLGGKTGYTSKAGQCLASLGEKYGMEYLLVTAGAGGRPRGDQLHLEDARIIYDQYLY